MCSRCVLSPGLVVHGWSLSLEHTHLVPDAHEEAVDAMVGRADAHLGKDDRELGVHGACMRLAESAPQQAAPCEQH